MEYFSKRVELFALPDHAATKVATCLIENVFSQFGLPIQLHSDQESKFMSNLFQAVRGRADSHDSVASPERGHGGKDESHHRSHAETICS